MESEVGVDERSGLDALAEFVTRLDEHTIPAGVRTEAALCLLDTVACIVAGSETEEGLLMLAAERELGPAGPADGVHVIGSDELLTAEAAARLHAYWGDIFELNDLIGGHASIGVVPAVLAAADRLGSSGAEVVTAIVAGIEVASRIYDAVYPTLKPYPDAGLVTPGLVNSFGAAAAVARLHRSPAREVQHAMAVAGALASWCPAEVIFGQGGTIKPNLFGSAPAAAGLRANVYASHGITGPPHLLESRIGLFPTLSTLDAWHLDANLGDWRLARPRRKLHACCGYIHAAIDAVVSLRETYGGEVFDDADIEIGMPAYVIPAVAKANPPRTPNEARFHVQYCVALAIEGADVIVPGHSTELAAHLPAVQRRLQHIGVVEDGRLDHYHQARVVVRRDGREDIALEIDGPRGTPRNPLTPDQVRAKAKRLLTGRIDDLDAFLVRLDAVDTDAPLSWLHPAVSPIGR